MDEKAHLIPTVNVKARHLFKDARKYWETEKRGAYAASLYYDCVAEAEKIADTGAEMPGIFEWLKSKNEYFDGLTLRMYDTKNGRKASFYVAYVMFAAQTRCLVRVKIGIMHINDFTVASI